MERGEQLFVHATIRRARYHVSRQFLYARNSNATRKMIGSGRRQDSRLYDPRCRFFARRSVENRDKR